MQIGSREIGLAVPPLVVAEVSGNHGGSLDRALEIVDAIADVGAEAIKFQTYTPESMTLRSSAPSFVIDSSRSPWFGRTLFDLYTEAQTPWIWHEALFERATQRGLIVFSSPFDSQAVELLDDLGAPCFKIASFEITDLELIRAAAVKGKPLIISTGMATKVEIETAVATARDAGCSDIIVLKCTSSYPARASQSNLLTIPDLREWTGCEVGLSDHTLGIGSAIASVALGASVIEKHVTDDRQLSTVDSAFSLEPDELGALVKEAREAWMALGQINYGPTADEEDSLFLRRSLFFCQDLPEGTRLENHHVKALRPHIGVGAEHLPRLLGSRLVRGVTRDEPLQFQDLHVDHVIEIRPEAQT